jgi:hypothetical protein
MWWRHVCKNTSLKVNNVHVKRNKISWHLCWYLHWKPSLFILHKTLFSYRWLYWITHRLTTTLSVWETSKKHQLRSLQKHQEIVLDHYRNTTIDEFTSGKLEPIATSSPKNRDNSRSTVHYSSTNSNTTSQSETTTKTDNLTILTINFQSITN